MQQFAVSPEFFCDVRRDQERVVVRVVGELDFAVAAHVAETLDELLEGGSSRVVVDLKGLDFMDSAGVHMLVSAHHAARRRGCALSLIRGSRNVDRVFRLTRTDSLFAVADVPGGV